MSPTDDSDIELLPSQPPQKPKASIATPRSSKQGKKRAIEFEVLGSSSEQSNEERIPVAGPSTKRPLAKKGKATATINGDSSDSSLPELDLSTAFGNSAGNSAGATRKGKGKAASVASPFPKRKAPMSPALKGKANGKAIVVNSDDDGIGEPGSPALEINSGESSADERPQTNNKKPTARGSVLKKRSETAEPKDDRSPSKKKKPKTNPADLPRPKPKPEGKPKPEKVFSRYAANPCRLEDLTDDEENPNIGRVPPAVPKPKPVHESLKRVQTILTHIANGTPTPEWIATGLNEAAELLRSTQGKAVLLAHRAAWPLEVRESLELEALSLVVVEECKSEPNWVQVRRRMDRLVGAWEGLKDGRHKGAAFRDRVAPALRKCHEALEKASVAKEEWAWFEGVTHRCCGTGDFEELLKSADIEALEKMYHRISALHDCIHSLHLLFGTYAVAHLSKHLASLDLTDQPTPKSYTQALRHAFREPQRILTEAFKNDKGFEKALGQTLRKGINENEVVKKEWEGKGKVKGEFFVARRLDTVLKKVDKSGEEPEEGEIAELMVIFTYLDDKDFFGNIHTKMLARRLVHDSSADPEKESEVISKMMVLCGTDYTAKMVKMTRDIQVNEDLNKVFKTKTIGKADDEPDAEFLVLCTAHWPIPNDPSKLILPAALTPLYTRFVQFYTNQHEGRKIRLAHMYNRLEVSTHYLEKPYVLQCSFLQGCLLLLFTKEMGDRLTLDEMVQGTGSDVDDLKPVLEMMCKQRVLVKGDEDAYELNFKFKYKSIRVPLSGALKSQAPTQTEVTRETEDQRKITVQAAIVRIAKARKEVKFVDIVRGVVDGLKKLFVVKVTVIKSQIDVLIEKEYLKRDDAQRDLYRYVA